jgi:8-oxo-dGTP pyrophosphatase MutT (NUDIX family)
MFKVPTIKSTNTVYQGYFDVRVDHLESEAGANMTYTCLEIKAHASAVLARTKEGLLIINKEYRHPTLTWVLGCPGGRIDEGESPLKAAQRELLEETGYSGGSVTLLGEVFSLPAVTDQIIYYTFIDGVTLTDAPKREPFELIHIELMSQEELMQKIASGHPVDAVLCTALLLYGYR